MRGEETADFPFPALLPEAKPVTEYLPGWHCDISGVRTWEALPAEARAYVEYLEKNLGCPVTYVSVGPAREEIVIR